VIPKALGNVHPSIAPYQVYDASDKKFIVAVGNDAQFIKFAGIVSPDLLGDKRFATNQLRVENITALNERLSSVFPPRVQSIGWINCNIFRFQPG